MFNMQVEQQMNIKDRTLLLGVPEYDVIPKSIFVDEKEFVVIGSSLGVKLPYLSLEIEKTNDNLVGKTLKQQKNNG